VKRTKNKIFFIEDLNLDYYTIIFLTRLVYNKIFDRININIIYFIDGSEKAQSLLAFILKIFKIQLEQLKFDFMDIKDEKGLLLGIKMHYTDLSNISKDISASSLFKKIIEKDKMTTEEKNYLKKQILEYNNDMLAREIFLVHIASWWARETDRHNVVFFMKPGVWEEEIKKFAKVYGVYVVWEGAFIRYSRRLLRLFFRYIKLFVQLQNFRKIWIYIKKQFQTNFKGSNADVSFDKSKIYSQSMNPCIAVLYFGNLNLNRPDLQSELFFWHQSQLSGEDLLVMFGLKLDPVDSKKESELKSHNISAISLNPESTLVTSIPVFSQSFNFGNIFPVKKGLKLLRNGLPSIKYLWLVEQSIMFEIKFNYWLQLFKDYNVKININWTKHDALHMTISAALKELGGISTIYQRSFDDLPYVRMMTTSDVLFSFDNDISNERKIGSVIPYHVAVGFIGDYRFKILKKPATIIRNQLQVNGAKHILAYFDESSSDDKRWGTNNDLDYEFLLEKVLSNPWLGLIIKPKKPFSLSTKPGSLLQMLELAKDSGRCIIIEDGTLKNHYPPAIAALASDVAISGHIFGGTAGFESALAGTPTIILDQENWQKSKLYNLGKGKVVFNDWENLWYACKDYFDYKCKIDGFGDWSPMLDELDPFRDGRAAERVGTYLKWLLDGFKEGLTRESILSDAAEKYASKWGYDNIASV